MRRFILTTVLLLCLPAWGHITGSMFGGTGGGSIYVGDDHYSKSEVDALLDLIDYAHVTGNDVLTDILATELETLSDGSDTGLHIHDRFYYTKPEIHDIVEGNTFDFFLNNTNSDISAPIQYFVMDPTGTGEGESTFADTITNDAFLIDSWATSTSEPTFSALVKGIYAFHIHGVTTTGANVGSVRLYWELYRRTHPGGVETLLITSEESSILVGVETEYDIHGTLTTDVMLDATDRLVLKVYGNIETSRPTDPLVTLTAEGTTAAHFEVVTTLTAFDDRYVLVTGDTMTGPLNISNIVSASSINLKPSGDDDDHLSFLTVDGVPHIDIIGNEFFVVSAGLGFSGVRYAADETHYLTTFWDGSTDTGIVGSTHKMLITSGNNEDINLIPDGTGLVNIESDLIITGTVDGIDVATDVAANTTHRGSNGTDHSLLSAFPGIAAASKALIVDGGRNINTLNDVGMETLTITAPTQNYQFLARDTPTSNLVWQSQDSDVGMVVDLFNKDGIGEDTTIIQFFGFGTPDQLTDRHQMQVGYSPNDAAYIISSISAGSQTDKPIIIRVGGSGLTVDVDGNVEFDGNISGTGNYNSSGTIQSGHIAIGQAPSGSDELVVRNDSGAASIRVQSNSTASIETRVLSNTAAVSAQWISKKSRASATVVIDGDRVGTFNFLGHDGTNFNTTGAILTVNVDGSVDTGKVPMEFVFEVLPEGETSRITAMKIRSSGNIEILQGVMIFTNLPTSDPSVTGQLYRSGADIKISL